MDKSSSHLRISDKITNIISKYYDLEVYKEVANEETAIFAPTNSPHSMAKEIGKYLQVDMHLNEKIKKINKNIITNNYNMEENLSKLIDSIFAL